MSDAAPPSPPPPADPARHHTGRRRRDRRRRGGRFAAPGPFLRLLGDGSPRRARRRGGRGRGARAPAGRRGDQGRVGPAGRPDAPTHGQAPLQQRGPPRRPDGLGVRHQDRPALCEEPRRCPPQGVGHAHGDGRRRRRRLGVRFSRCCSSRSSSSFSSFLSSVVFFLSRSSSSSSSFFFSPREAAPGPLHGPDRRPPGPHPHRHHGLRGQPPQGAEHAQEVAGLQLGRRGRVDRDVDRGAPPRPAAARGPRRVGPAQRHEAPALLRPRRGAPQGRGRALRLEHRAPLRAQPRPRRAGGLQAERALAGPGPRVPGQADPARVHRGAHRQVAREDRGLGLGVGQLVPPARQQGAAAARAHARGRRGGGLLEEPGLRHQPPQHQLGHLQPLARRGCPPEAGRPGQGALPGVRLLRRGPEGHARRAVARRRQELALPRADPQGRAPDEARHALGLGKGREEREFFFCSFGLFFPFSHILLLSLSFSSSPLPKRCNGRSKSPWGTCWRPRRSQETESSWKMARSRRPRSRSAPPTRR